MAVHVAKIFSVLLANALSQEQFEQCKKDEFFEGWIEDSQDWGDVAGDFTRLFVCDEKSLKAPPCASFYLHKSGENYTLITDEVEEFYERFGFTNSTLKPHDHISVELDFLSSLLNSPECEEFVGEFLGHYLLPWIFVWCKHVKQNASTKFYKNLALHVEEFMRELGEGVEVSSREIFNNSF